MELGTLGEWVGGVLGTLLSLVSLIVAIRAQKNTEEAESRRQEFEDRYKAWQQKAEETRLAFDDQVRKREQDRDIRRAASALQAWWVMNNQDGKWGIMLRNGSTDGLVVSDVRIRASRFSKKANKTYHLERDLVRVPPGFYFLESKIDEQASIGQLDDPKLVHYLNDSGDEKDLHHWQPITFAHTHKVDSLEFQDATRHWKWTLDEGMQEIPKERT